MPRRGVDIAAHGSPEHKVNFSNGQETYPSQDVAALGSNFKVCPSHNICQIQARRGMAIALFAPGQLCFQGGKREVRKGGMEARTPNA